MNRMSMLRSEKKCLKLSSQAGYAELRSGTKIEKGRSFNLVHVLDRGEYV